VYRVLVSIDFLQMKRPPKRDRERMLSFLEGLAENPFVRGDYEEQDEAGRPIQIKIMGKYAMTYWVDHAVKEVKVTRLELADQRAGGQ
jgi:mRNA-degrading endonuclease RelE of RelBE toxin-antitoxin system